MKGTVGDGFTGDIGLDDMSFLGCTLYNGKSRIKVTCKSLICDDCFPSFVSIATGETKPDQTNHIWQGSLDLFPSFLPHI